MTDAGVIHVRCESHRARHKMFRITGPVRSKYTLPHYTHYYPVPAELADQVLAITGVKKGRPTGPLLHSW